MDQDQNTPSSIINMDERLLPNDNSNDNTNDSESHMPIISRILSIFKPTSIKSYMIIVTTFILYTLIAGITIGFLPLGAGWRLFSWHPFLMILGVIGMMGVALHTKKLGGYKNTKLHAIMTTSGLVMALGGLAVIYENKALAGKPHFTSVHSIFGLVTLCGFGLSMLAGLIYLHPDFGIDQRDDKKRLVHKWFARTMILSAWITCFLGLQHLTSNDITVLVLFTVPLFLLAPITLL